MNIKGLVEYNVSTTESNIVVTITLPEFREGLKQEKRSIAELRANPQEVYNLLIEDGFKPGRLINGNTIRNLPKGNEQDCFTFCNLDVKIQNALKEIKKEQQQVKKEQQQVKKEQQQVKKEQQQVKKEQPKKRIRRTKKSVE